MELNKTTSTELDELLRILLIDWRARLNTAAWMINVRQAYKTSPTLKEKPAEYIDDLLYLAKKEEPTTLNLFDGDSFLALDEKAVVAFLRGGGFSGIYKERRNKKHSESYKFWFTNALVIIGILVTINYPTCKKNAESKQSKAPLRLPKEQHSVLFDSTKKVNPKNDSTIRR